MCYVTEAGISALGVRVFVMLGKAEISALGGKMDTFFVQMDAWLREVLQSLKRSLSYDS